MKPVAPLFILLGKTNMKAKRFENAIASFERAIEIMVCDLFKRHTFSLVVISADCRCIQYTSTFPEKALLPDSSLLFLCIKLSAFSRQRRKQAMYYSTVINFLSHRPVRAPSHPPSLSPSFPSLLVRRWVDVLMFLIMFGFLSSPDSMES